MQITAYEIIFSILLAQSLLAQKACVTVQILASHCTLLPSTP